MAETPSSKLPLREIPGDYGIPYFGAVKDRLDYFWIEGEQKFYQSRIEKYKSTVFRVNMPPGPVISKDSRVICLLDQKSFPILFDMEKCEKKDVFCGTYMPDLSFTSGYRVCAYLDPSEDRHTKLKQWCFDIIAKNGRNFLPEFHKAIGESMVLWEKDVADGKKAQFSGEVDQFPFNFLFRAICHHDPAAPGPASLGRDGGPGALLWAAAQLAPKNKPQTDDPEAAELSFHTVPVPSTLVKTKYDAIYKFVKTYATEALDLAEASGIERDDATANLVFFLSFNALGGFYFSFTALIAFINSAGKDLMHELHEEVLAAVADTDGTVTLEAIENMPLLKSVVYESFRFKPPVPPQYARAKTDFVIENHENSFQVKKGELLYGYQPIVTHDPKVFDNPNQFLPRRFLGPEGEKLIKYVFWSNGPETSKPSVHNKQCAGKNLVVPISRAFVAEMFLRYKDYTLEVQGSGSLAKLFFTALTKA